MNIDEAKALALECYPDAPEAIADALGIEIVRAPMTGADGWLTRGGRHPRVRINSNVARARQRFTLAHEIAHFLLGTETEVQSHSILPFSSVKAAERAADELAADLLLPLEHMMRVSWPSPVDSKSISLTAKAAKVSEVVVGVRLVNLRAELGLGRASVLQFQGNEIKWQYRGGLNKLSKDLCTDVFEAASKKKPATERVPLERDQVICCTMCGSEDWGFVFVQLLPAKNVSKQTDNERIAELEHSLFDGNHSWRQSINACVGMFQKHAAKMTSEQAVIAFCDRYANKWDGDAGRRFRSNACREWLKLRMKRWSLPD